MNYYIVKKFNKVDGELVGVPIGYIDSEEDRVSFENFHGTPIIDWVSANNPSNPADYFDTHDPCYLLDTYTDNSCPVGISLISNIEHPES